MTDGLQLPPVIAWCYYPVVSCHYYGRSLKLFKY